MQEINVEKIMEEVRKDIKERGIQEEPVRFREAYEEELPFVIPTQFDMETLHNETLNAMALWDTSVEPLTNAAGLKGKVKKILNKLAIHSMNSHMISQNAFNTSVINALLQINKLAEENSNMLKKNAEMLAENKKMQEEIGTLKKEIEILKLNKE